jgi:hypothetical protein
MDVFTWVFYVVFSPGSAVLFRARLSSYYMMFIQYEQDHIKHQDIEIHNGKAFHYSLSCFFQIIFSESQDSSYHRLDDWGSISSTGKDLSFCQYVKNGSGVHPTEWVLRVLYLGLKWTQHET